MPFHILADPGSIAECSLVVGDPGRAQTIASMLDGVRLVNSNRGLLTYTGEWLGKRVTIATHGMGGPGAAIVFEELIELGARVLVRLGTTGAIRRGVRVGDVVVATGAMYYHGGLFEAYFDRICGVAVPDFEVTRVLVEEAKRERLRVWAEPVFSSDAFYAETREVIEEWARAGAVSVEMECATLFAVSRLRGARAGAILVVNGTHVEDEERIVPEERVRESMLKAARAALNTLVRL